MKLHIPKMINNNKAILYSDISKDNAPSIKIHEANNFKKIDEIKYPKERQIIIKRVTYIFKRKKIN